MKKVLFITYYFPPNNLTGANRVFAYASYLNEYGIKPVIVTRNWDIPIENNIDLHKKSGTKTRHENHGNYEVYYIPYRPSVKDRILSKFGEQRFVFLRKIFTFLEMYIQNFCSSISSTYSLYRFAKKLMTTNEYSKLVVTANPFILFKYGQLLHKQFNIPWVADYRDDWTTTDWERPMDFLNRLVFAKEMKSEKKWVGTASQIISVSDYYSQKISDYTGVPGSVLVNGYHKADFKHVNNNPNPEIFTITYVGLLYPDQKIEYFIEEFQSFIKANKIEAGKIKIKFIGLLLEKSQCQRIEKLMAGFESYYEITGWMNKKELIAHLEESQVLLLIPAEGIKGVPASKTYEYLAMQKPILLFPSDNDAMEETIKHSGLSFIANNKEDLQKYLKYFWSQHKKNDSIDINPNINYIEQFSRYNQVKVLADILNQD